jgi:acyl-CoA thioesterase
MVNADLHFTKSFVRAAAPLPPVNPAVQLAALGFLSDSWMVFVANMANAEWFAAVGGVDGVAMEAIINHDVWFYDAGPDVSNWLVCEV